MDFKGNDDCGIYKVGDDCILVQSVDFITPIVDDLYAYGQIAAANSLSDVFAKGSNAHTAMSVLMWDKEHLSQSDANEILQGSLSKLIESSCTLLGGHSIVDKEQKYGLSVTGIINDGIFWRNNTARVGDSIILTKPIGSGILSTAFKNNLLAFDKNLDVVQSMVSLNMESMRITKEFSKKYGIAISACSDVTGFGLIGHLIEMINENISINLFSNEVKLFNNVEHFMKLGVIPGGSYANKAALSKYVQNTRGIDDIIYYDAQTSGGLLIALNKNNAVELLNRLLDKGINASIIAECVNKSEYKLYLH